MLKYYSKKINTLGLLNYPKFVFMKIIFFGTPPFSAYILEKLGSEFNIVSVVSPLDKEKGRGRKIILSAVKMKAEELGIEVLQPPNLQDYTFLNKLSNLDADLFIVVAFRMLPKDIWKLPKKGCVNLHTSLLPSYRGAAPINRVLINGEKQTGITTFFINKNIDTGNIILQEKINLDDNITAATLHNIMMKNGATLLIKTVKKIGNNSATEIVQKQEKDDKSAPKLNKTLLKIDWRRSALNIHNLIRGLSPCLEDNTLLKDVAICPSSWFYLVTNNTKKIRIKLLLSKIENTNNTTKNGEIITDNKSFMKISAKDGYISILKLQMEGKKAMDIKSFLTGFIIEENFRIN